MTLEISQGDKEQLIGHLGWNYSRSWWEREGQLVVFLTKNQMKYILDLIKKDCPNIFKTKD